MSRFRSANCEVKLLSVARNNSVLKYSEGSRTRELKNKGGNYYMAKTVNPSLYNLIYYGLMDIL